jgi:hypothetical protein
MISYGHLSVFFKSDFLNLIDKKDSYLIPRPPSWDDRNYSYGHQLYPSVNAVCLVEKQQIPILQYLG